MGPVSIDRVDRPDFFGDVRTRQAFAHCFDRQGFVDRNLPGLSAVPHTYLADNHPLANHLAARYLYNPSQGNALLEEVGWTDHDGDPLTARVAAGVVNVPDGTPFSVNIWTPHSTHRQWSAELLAQDLAACGIQINVEFWDHEKYFADGPDGLYFGRHFELAQIAFFSIKRTPNCGEFLSENIPGPPDALNDSGLPLFHYGWSRLNTGGYRSREYDEVCRSALSLLPGEPGYNIFHQSAQEIFARDLPVLPLYFRYAWTISRPDFCGYWVGPNARSNFWNVEEYNYGPGCL